MKATDSLYQWQYNDGNFIKAELSGDGTLSITIKATGKPRAGGTYLVQAAIKHFGKNRIARFQGEWRRGTGYERNYREYLANLATMSREDAARATWTGALMRDELDFTHVSVPPHGPNPDVVWPVFSR